jgi:hypothetical protein
MRYRHWIDVGKKRAFILPLAPVPSWLQLHGSLSVFTGRPLAYYGFPRTNQDTAMRISLLFQCLFLAVASTGCSMMSTPDNLDLRLARPSAHGTYLVTLQPPADSVGLNRLHSWQLQISAADGSAVSNASVQFDGGMPQHHHGFPTSPRVSTGSGSGAYRIDGVKFSMGGWWEIKLAIDAPQGSDTVTFNTVLSDAGLLLPKASVQ